MNTSRTMTQTMRPTPSEEQLVRAAQQGCTDSFRCLVERFGAPLVRYLQRRTGSAQDAEDLAQETFIRVYSNLGTYRHSGRFSTWLYTIASRLAVSHHRRRRPVVPISDQIPSDTVTDPSTSLETAERNRTILRMAQSLPALQRQALELRYLEQMTIEDIARILGKTQIYVKVLLHRARLNLADRLGREHGFVDAPQSQPFRPAAETGKRR